MKLAKKGEHELPCLSPSRNDLRRILPSVKPPSRTVEQLWGEPQFLAPLWACRIRIAHILLKCLQLSKVHGKKQSLTVGRVCLPEASQLVALLHPIRRPIAF